MTAPKITVGMSEAEVRGHLGSPKIKRGGGDIMAALSRRVIGNTGGVAAMEFAVYEHAAGTYQLVFRNGVVSEVNSHP